MSNTYSYLAALCDIEEMEKAVLGAWPTIEIAEPIEKFASFEAAYQWAAPRSGYLQGTHPNEVKMFFRDGDWSVVADFSLCMSDEEASLAELSRRLGRVVVATTHVTRSVVANISDIAPDQFGRVADAASEMLNSLR